MPFDSASAEREPRIAILGTGLAGLAMAAALARKGRANWRVYEKAGDVGGTWRDNRYPGVACDAPSHLYCYSDEPNPEWSQRFSPGGEILAYMRAVARKHGVYERAEFGRRVTKLRHDGREWTLDFADGQPAKADIVVSALGGLHLPKKPRFDGIERFSGPIVHTAEWPRDLDLSGRRVAVIGTAASAAQIIPELARTASHLDVYQRTPNWVMPRQAYAYPDWARALFRASPPLAKLYRLWYFAMLDGRHSGYRKVDTFMKRVMRAEFIRHMRAQVKDEALLAKLIPDYDVGCKRVVISDDYLPALQQANVELVVDPIERFDGGGILAGGRLREADAAVLATGFDVFTLARTVHVEGPLGVTLAEAWKGGVVTHRTLAAPGFPNFFMLLGPNSGVGHNSVILMIEAQVKYLMRLFDLMQARGAHLVEPTLEATARFDRGLREAHAKMVWESGCRSWFLDEAGRNFTLYPHSVSRFIRDMRAPDPAEYLFHETAAQPA